jgi:hypothetical protein
MHRPELSRKPLVGEMGALRAISCIPVEGEPDYYRMEESEHDGSLDWLGTVSRPIVLSFDGNHWNRSVVQKQSTYPTAAIGGYWRISSSAATRFIDCVIPSSTTPSRYEVTAVVCGTITFERRCYLQSYI